MEFYSPQPQDIEVNISPARHPKLKSLPHPVVYLPLGSVFSVVYVVRILPIPRVRDITVI